MKKSIIIVVTALVLSCNNNTDQNSSQRDSLSGINEDSSSLPTVDTLGPPDTTTPATR